MLLCSETTQKRITTHHLHAQCVEEEKHHMHRSENTISSIFPNFTIPFTTTDLLHQVFGSESYIKTFPAVFYL